ncbi:MAG: HNH endonuclease [Pseudomonas sp.]
MIEKFLGLNRNRLQAFSQRYEFRVVSIVSPTQDKIYLGQGQPRICRYCGEDASSTTFKEQSHAIPIFLGNKTVIDLLECDRCNHHFGDHFENSFANYTHPHRSFQRTRGRSGIPVYKDKDFRVSASDQSNLKIWSQGKEGLNALKVEGENRLKLPLARQPYYPTAIHKSLVKIALAVMPAADHAKFAGLKEWLLSKDHAPAFSGAVPVIEWMISGPVNPNRIMCLLARAKERYREAVFQYQLIFQYGNFQYQLVIPLSEESGQKKDFVYAPLLLPEKHFLQYGPSDYQEKNFLSGERVVGEVVDLHIRYETREPEGSVGEPALLRPSQ